VRGLFIDWSKKRLIRNRQIAPTEQLDGNVTKASTSGLMDEGYIVTFPSSCSVGAIWRFPIGRTIDQSMNRPRKDFPVFVGAPH